MKLTVYTLFCILFISPAMLSAADTPYAGQETREIKSLSADEVQGLLAGKGMGLAKSAELNGYPGPRHVLELESELELSTQQKEQSEALYQAMASEARSLGEQVIEKERILDDLFASQRITVESLDTTLAEIGALRGQLRAVHLRTHLAQTSVLSGEQIARYNQLRGYTGAGAESTHNQHMHHKH